MLLDNPLTEDQRVLREAESLIKAGNSVTVYCVKNNFSASEILNGIVVKRILSEQVFKVRNNDYLNQKAIEQGIQSEYHWMVGVAHGVKTTSPYWDSCKVWTNEFLYQFSSIQIPQLIEYPDGDYGDLGSKVIPQTYQIHSNSQYRSLVNIDTLQYNGINGSTSNCSNGLKKKFWKFNINTSNFL